MGLLSFTLPVTKLRCFILVRLSGTERTAKIADFGLSKYTSRYMHTYLGTLLYMAPESWYTQPGYTNSIDVWAFGVIALEFLTEWDRDPSGSFAEVAHKA